jgi:hypothetical protein
MKRIAAWVLLAAATMAFADIDPNTLQAPPSERWFSLDKTSTGYVAGGNLAGTLWAFHVRGEQMKRLGAEASTTFSLDGAVIQVRAIPRTVVTAGTGDILAAHKRYEQEHQVSATKGVTFGDHAFCTGAKVPHAQWTAQSGGLVQAYVTFEVGDYVLMVVSPYENEARRAVVANALQDVCTSFRREKAS